MSAAHGPLRILQVAAPGPAGGLESVIAALAPGLCRRGHAVGLVAVLGPGDPPDFLQPIAAAGVEVQPLRLPGRAYLRERQVVMEFATRWQADVVHTHGYRADVVSGVAAARSGLPTVTTVHGFTGGDFKNRIYEFLQVRAFKRIGAVVAVSTPLRERLWRAGVPAARLHVIRNAWASCGATLSRADARRQLGLPLEGQIVGWVGRLSPEKGADVFLDAIARGPWSASIIGEGRAGEPLRKQAHSLGLGDRVRWHGMVPGAGALLSAFDLVVLSSRTEGTPMILFEAMDAGVPIVATAVGGVPDVLGREEALLVRSDDPALLAEAIRTALADPMGAAARAARARDRLRSEFAPEPWLDHYQALYRSLLPPSRR